MEPEYQQVLHVARREDKEVLAAFRVGSQVYGTATPESDRDYVVVLADCTRDDLARGTGIDVIVRGISSFQDSLRNGNIFSLECVFAPSSHILKRLVEFETFKVKDDAHRERVVFSALEKAQADYSKGIRINDPERVYHAFRVLDFAIQIVESGRIYDFLAARKIYEVVMTEPRPLETAFQSMFEERWAYLRSRV